MRSCGGGGVGGVVGVVVTGGSAEGVVGVVGDGAGLTVLLSPTECWAFADATIASQLTSTCGSGAKCF